MPYRVIVVGSSGHMGREVIKLIDESDTFVLANTIDEGDDYQGEGDVIIDFSHHSTTEPLLEFAVAKSIPAVIATTGQTDAERTAIKEASEKIAIFKSANMSLGIALLNKLVKEAAAKMGDADIEIIEKHHNRKLDAPSGTALLLADGIKEVKPESEFICGRSGQGKRGENEIGIHAIRSGNIVGEHEVSIGTNNQTITLKHEAHDRALFADGAIRAAEYLLRQKPGLYNMEDLINES